MDPLIQELIDFIKAASPLIWQAFARQVLYLGWANMIGAGIAWAFGIFNLIRGMQIKTGKFTPWWAWDDDDIYFLPLFVGLGLAILGGIAFFSGLPKLFNPDYYTIQLILATLKGQ